MAQRGQRVPGNALASKLRDVELRSRPGRSRGAAGATGATGPQGPQGANGAAVATQVITTGAGGLGTWVFPEPLTAVPTVSATAAPPTVIPVITNIVAVSTTEVTVSTWNITNTPRANVPVHILLG